MVAHAISYRVLDPALELLTAISTKNIKCPNLFYNDCHGIVHATIHDLCSFTHGNVPDSFIAHTTSNTISGF